MTLPGLSLLLALLPRLGPTQAPPVFEARVEYVYVDVFVTDHGAPILDLLAKNFELRDDGVPQSVELLTANATPLRTVLVLDSSESVRGERLAALQSAGRAFLLGLSSEDQATLLTFSHEVRRRGESKGEFRTMALEMEAIEASGSTSVFDALFTAFLTAGSRERGLIVLFSDGEDNFSWLRAEDVRRVAERSSAVLEVVTVRAPRDSVGAAEHQHFLRALAESTGGRVSEAGSPDRVIESFARILTAMRARYVLRYEPARVKGLGEHRLQVSLKGAHGQVRARPSYFRTHTP